MKRIGYASLLILNTLQACTSLELPTRMEGASSDQDASLSDDGGSGAGGGVGGPENTGGQGSPQAGIGGAIPGAGGIGGGGGSSDVGTGGGGAGGDGGSGGAADPSAPLDGDGDGVADAQDNCVDSTNSDQADLDDDGTGDPCDDDRDGDGVLNVADGCPDASDPGQLDLDDDGSGDACDADRDGDAIANDADNCSELANPEQYDLDGDGVGYGCDDDDEVIDSGTLNNWSEADAYEIDLLAGAHGSGIVIKWSASATDLVWIYGRLEGLEVAKATAGTFGAIADTTALAYTNDSLRLAAGEIAVLRNTIRGTYAALRVESAAYDGSTWRANMAWLFAGRRTSFAGL